MQVASEIRSITCISCPLGCVIEVSFDAHGEIEDISGYKCPLGEDYARVEAVSPRRMVCAALGIKGSLEPLSVKTAEAIPKERIGEVVDAINALQLETPIEEGTILTENIAATGVALIATKSLAGD